MSAKVFKFPLGMVLDLRRAATLGAPDAPALYGYGMFGGGAGLPHDVYRRDLAHGIDQNTPGVSVFAVAFGCAYDQLVDRAVADFASGAFTLH